MLRPSAKEQGKNGNGGSGERGGCEVGSDPEGSRGGRTKGSSRNKPSQAKKEDEKLRQSLQEEDYKKKIGAMKCQAKHCSGPERKRES